MKFTDSVLQKDEVYAGHSPAMNLIHGGNNGYMPKIGGLENGKNVEEWIGNHGYIKRNLIPIVIVYPKFFDLMPDKEKWIATYKALIELHPLVIDGLNSGLTVETDEHPVGGGGEFQEEITDVKRQRSSLSFTFKEKAGKAIQKFLDYLIRYGYMDPDVKKPLVTKYIKDISEIGGMYTPDFYAGSVLFIEPDITQKVVVDAWLCSNMFFKGNGDRTGKLDKQSAGELGELSIESSSITLNNEAVLEFADTVLQSLTVLNKIPDTDLTLPTNSIDPSVDSAQTGYNS